MDAQLIVKTAACGEWLWH